MVVNQVISKYNFEINKFYNINNNIHKLFILNLNNNIK